MKKAVGGGGGEGGDTAVTVGIKRGVLTHWDPSPFALTELDPISASKLGQVEGGHQISKTRNECVFFWVLYYQRGSKLGRQVNLSLFVFYFFTVLWP